MAFNKKSKAMRTSVNYLLFLLLIAVSFMACEKTNIEDDQLALSAEDLCQAIVEMDDEKLAIELEIFLADLTPTPTATDEIGHELNINVLVGRLDKLACLSANLICYACIYTLPAISEIRVMHTDGDVITARTMDIVTPDDELLRFLATHN